MKHKPINVMPILATHKGTWAILAGFAGAALVIVLGFLSLQNRDVYRPYFVEPKPIVQIQEDEPGWDCRIDGNRICGSWQ